MKLFQKTALAVAIAAVPFLSVNALEALDDSTLSEMTGQAGVTIEQTLDQTGITIGTIKYTDTLATGETDGTGGVVGGGSLLINGDVDGDGTNYGIKIQGWNPTLNAAADSISRRTIDINEDGDLITKSVQIDGFGGGVIPVTGKRIQVGSVNLQNAAATATVSLVSNLDMIMLEAGSEAHILNLQGANNTRAAGMAAYQIGGKTVDVRNADGNIAIVTSSTSKISNLDVDALDGAISIRGLSYGESVTASNPLGLMSSTQVIWAKGGAAAAGGGVYIQGSDSTGTLNINSIAIGGGTIGSVAITDISQAGSTMRIYGH